MKFGEVNSSKITKATTKTPYVCTINMVEESPMQKKKLVMNHGNVGPIAKWG
jgi:hypothetical protein